MSAPPKPEKRTFLLIQALRGIAALMVVAYHVPLVFHRPGSFSGDSGVHIFFVISGFVMTVSSVSLASQPHPARTFFVRRLERIVPLYWLVITVKLLLLLAVPSAGRPPASAWHVVSSYLFLPDIARSNLLPFVLGGWSLNFEMIFYALFAVALALRVKPWKFLAFTIPVLSVVSFLLPQNGIDERIIPEFLLGVLIGELVLREEVPGPRAGALLLVAGFVGLCSIHPPPAVPHLFAWAIPATAVVAGAVALEQRLGQGIPRFVLEVGDASYAIYLTHDFVLSGLWMICRHHAEAPWIVPFSMVTGLVCSVAVGIAVHRTIELPLMKFFRWHRNRGVAANVVA